MSRLLVYRRVIQQHPREKTRFWGCISAVQPGPTPRCRHLALLALPLFIVREHLLLYSDNPFVKQDHQKNTSHIYIIIYIITYKNKICISIYMLQVITSPSSQIFAPWCIPAWHPKRCTSPASPRCTAVHCLLSPLSSPKKMGMSNKELKCETSIVIYYPTNYNNNRNYFQDNPQKL